MLAAFSDLKTPDPPKKVESRRKKFGLTNINLNRSLIFFNDMVNLKMRFLVL